MHAIMGQKSDKKRGQKKGDKKGGQKKGERYLPSFYFFYFLMLDIGVGTWDAGCWTWDAGCWIIPR